MTVVRADYRSLEGGLRGARPRRRIGGAGDARAGMRVAGERRAPRRRRPARPSGGRGVPAALPRVVGALRADDRGRGRGGRSDRARDSPDRRRAASGLELDTRYAHVWTIRDGLGVRVDAYRDPDAIRWALLADRAAAREARALATPPRTPRRRDRPAAPRSRRRLKTTRARSSSAASAVNASAGPRRRPASFSHSAKPAATPNPIRNEADRPRRSAESAATARSTSRRPERRKGRRRSRLGSAQARARIGPARGAGSGLQPARDRFGRPDLPGERPREERSHERNRRRARTSRTGCRGRTSPGGRASSPAGSRRSWRRPASRSARATTRAGAPPRRAALVPPSRRRRGTPR